MGTVIESQGDTVEAQGRDVFRLGADERSREAEGELAGPQRECGVAIEGEKHINVY